MESENLKSIKFPEHPKKGDTVRKLVNGRIVTFSATGLAGFGKWQITANEPLSVLEKEQETHKAFWKEAVVMETKAEKPLKQRIKKMLKTSPSKKEKEDQGLKSRWTKQNKPMTKEGLKGMTIIALENRQNRLKSKYQQANEKRNKSESSLSDIEFDIKQPGVDSEELEQKRNTIKHNLKIDKRLMKYYLKLSIEAAKERESRTLKSNPKSKFKLW